MLERMNFMLGFSPWILLAALAGNTLHSLKVAIIVSLFTVLLFGYKHLAKGFVLTWGTLLFFAFNLITVVFLENLWIASRMAILANAMLAVIAWASLIIGKPFTIQYAREHVSKEISQAPVFFHKNRVVTAVWGAVFLSSTATSLLRFYHHTPRTWIYRVITVIVIQLGITFTIWYPKRRM